MRGHALRLGILGLTWLALTGGVFSGCRGLFTPAVPEPPSGPPLVANYGTPNATLNTMAAGIARKTQDGSAAYLGAFADSTSKDTPAYHQFFFPAVVDRCNQTPGCSVPEWTLALERNFYQYFVGLRPNDTYELSWQVDVEHPDPPSDGVTAEVHRHYQVIAKATSGNTSKVIAIGYADLILTKLSDKWQITRWDDRVDPLIGVNPADAQQLSFGARRLES